MLEELRIEVNTACNFACTHCYTNKKRSGALLDIEIFEAAIYKAASGGVSGLSLTGGEPLLDLERLTRLIEAGKRVGMHVRLNTNGYLLDGAVAEKLLAAGLNEVQVSLSSDQSDDFDLLVRRRGAFEKVKRAIQALSQRKIFTAVRYTLMARNVHRLLTTYEMVCEWGVDKFKVRCLVDVPGVNETLEDVSVSRAKLRLELEALSFKSQALGVAVDIADDGLGAEFGLGTKCERIQCKCGDKAIFVASDGRVSPCPFLREAHEFDAGSILSTDIMKIYNESNVIRNFVGAAPSGHKGGNDHVNTCKASHITVAQITIGSRTFSGLRAREGF